MAADRPWTVGRQMHIGTESENRRDHDAGQVVHELGDDGRLITPTYVPLHVGLAGRSADFPHDAEHTGTCIAVTGIGDVHMRCTCGARWTFNPNPATPICAARGPLCLLLRGGHDCLYNAAEAHDAHVCHCGTEWTDSEGVLPHQRAGIQFADETERPIIR